MSPKVALKNRSDNQLNSLPQAMRMLVTCLVLLLTSLPAQSAHESLLNRLDSLVTRLGYLQDALEVSVQNDTANTFRLLLSDAKAAALALPDQRRVSALKHALLSDLDQIHRLLQARRADQSAAPTLVSLSNRKVDQLRLQALEFKTSELAYHALSWRERTSQVLLGDPQHANSILGVIIASGLLLLALIWYYRSRKRSKLKTIQTVLNSIPDAIALFNPKGKLTATNQKFLKLLPLEIRPSALLRSSCTDLFAQLSPDNQAIDRARDRARQSLMNPDATLSFEVPSYGSQSLLVKERHNQDGGKTITVYGDHRNRGHLSKDPLTALPNRATLVQELTQRCSRASNKIALMIVDLKSFRQINDTYGRATGDELLKQTAITLQDCMPADALIARTAGDEFAVLLEFDLDSDDIKRRVATFLDTLQRGLKVSKMNVPARASVGIAFAPEHGNTVSALLTCADSACAHAKQVGNNALVVFNSTQQREAQRRHQLEVGLQQAVEKNELSLQYQPQIDINTKMTCGMEALLRWRSKEFGRVAPGEFIYIAEQTGIITQLGMWVLHKAIGDYQRLARFGMSPSTLSVNLSRKQFDNGRIVHDVAKVLDDTGFDPANLCLEITETALFKDSSAMRGILHELTDLGAKLAIDDFGVGYSSLLELRDFPIAEVKIDRAFVTDIATNVNSQDIISAVVSIAESIGAEVVAEGIENQEQFDAIADLGCDRAQGYYLCEPMAATTFPDLVLSA